MHSLIIFSPMPPLRNGIADYTRALLDFHCRDYDCIVVIDDAAPEPTGLPPDVLAMRHAEYRRHARDLGQHRHLFHVGNNDDHIYMLDHLSTVRGTVVLHDPSLRYMLGEARAGGKAWHDWERRATWRSHGSAGAVLADQAAMFRWQTIVNYLELNGIGEVVPAACGAIAHSWYGLMKIEQARPGLPCRRIEHFADIPKGDRESRRADARRALGLATDEIILVSLGFVTNAKQIQQVLTALSIAQSSLPRLRYIVVGQEFDLSVVAAAREHGVQHLVKHVGYVPEAEIATYLDAADILVNLRYPTMGETSGTLCRALARGVCAFVSDHGSYAELPDSTVVKVAPVAEVAAELASLLLAHIKLPHLRYGVERAAYAWASDNLAITKVVSAYHQAIEAFHNAPASRVQPTQALRCEPDPTTATIRERIGALPPDRLNPTAATFVGSLWWTEAPVPLPGSDDKLLVGGVPALQSSVELILGVATTRQGPSDVGLFASGWSGVSRSGVALAEFVTRLAPDGAAFFDLWQDDDKDPPLTIESLRDTLTLHDLDVVAVADGSSKPLFALGLKERMPVEVGILARRRAHAVRPRAA